jgi:hemolysin activation/secretion protein
MRTRRSCWLGATVLAFAWSSAAGAQEAAVETAPSAPALQDSVGEAPSEARRLDILNYRVEGNTLLSRLDVERAVYPFLGPGRTADDVEKARAALEKVYHDKGYETVGVEIPEQDVRGGLIRLNVTELKVGRLRVTGARYYSPERIREQAPSLREGQAPNYNDVTRDVAALNKSQDRIVTPTLRAGNTPGTVDVDLQVEDSLPVHGTVELNDRFSNRTERLRLSASVSYANLFQRNHSLSLQGQVSPQDPDQSWVVSGSYVAPIEGTPFTLVGYGVHSDSDVAAIGGIGVLGSGDIIGARAIYAFQKMGAVHQIIAGIDYKSFNEDLVQLGADTATTPIDYFPLTAQYSMGLRDDIREVDFTAALNVGVRGLDADDEEFRFKRYNASASWAYVRLDGSWLQKLAWGTQAKLSIASQISGRPLISNEQFSIGGWDSVRGYYESQELGDDGVSAQFNLESPSWHKLLGNAAQELRIFAFADAGYVRIFGALPDLNDYVKDEANLASVGAGVRVRLLKRLNTTVLLAAPLLDRDETKTDVGDLRAQFRLWADF